MRSQILLTSLCLAASSSAQPVLQYADLDIAGAFFDLYGVVNVGDSDFEADGADVDWDFTTSQVDLVGAAIFSLPAGTPYAADHPEAELAMTVIQDAGTSYSYYDVTTSGMHVLANGLGGPNGEVFTDPSTILQFPFSFNQQFTDDFAVDGSPSSVTRTYSGHGTVTSVLGTDNAVVKVSSSSGERSFYRSDPLEPLFSIGSNGTMIFWERIDIGIAEQRGLVGMTLAPNPASTFFRIPGLDAAATWRLVDATGRELMAGRVSGAQHSIDVSSLSVGIYRVLVQDARGMRSAALLKE